MKNNKTPPGEPLPDLFSAVAQPAGPKAAKPKPAQRPLSSAPALPLALDKPLVFLDLEATGLDVKEDRIVELAAVKLLPDGSRDSFVHRLNPGIRIPVEASMVHGIYDADVKESPSFSDIAKELLTFLLDCDLAGFGIARYDLHLLTQEFKRAGYEFSAAGRRVVDAQIIFHKREPRDLSAALLFFRGKKLEGAHGALADTEASIEVVLGQLERYGDLPRDVAGLHAASNQSDDRFVDSQARLFWRHGEAAFNFGKYRSRSLLEIARSDPRYLEWLVSEGKSAPDLLEIYRNALKGAFPKKPS